MKQKKKIILISCILIISFVFIFAINIKLLMGNSSYTTISIREQEKHTLNEDYVSACESTDSRVVKAKAFRNKCILTGVSVGEADIEAFIANDGISSKSYHVSVGKNVKINKKFRISMRSLIFNIDTTNMNDIDFKYCLSHKNEGCSQQSINKSSDVTINNKTVRFNNLNSSVKTVCLYAYSSGKLIDKVCVDRGFLNIFW